jgi:hypothetical protein
MGTESPLIAYTKDVMPLYIDSAKTYAQLSIGALAFSIAFKEKVLGQKGPLRAGFVLISSWSLFLISIAASAWYQYISVKFIEFVRNSELTSDATPGLVGGLLGPAPAYGAMLVSFFLGALLLVVASSRQLFSSQP